MKTKQKIHLSLGLLLAIGLAAFLTGCSEDSPILPDPGDTSWSDSGAGEVDFDHEFDQAADKGIVIVVQDGSAIPAEIAQVNSGEESISFWPYTGTSLVDTPVDPINVVFKGKASPVQIRQALMSLDGDRSAFGFPDIPPFNLPWTDAVGGDVQTTYLTEGGWEGCVIQLTLGEYSGLRVHLRLFATGDPSTGNNDTNADTWTLGGAHFEMMIPGTSEHQVLSWELAELLVTADMARTGLLGANPVPTDMINAAPSFRAIPTFIYNPLVEDPMGQMLLTVLEYPLELQDADFPLPTDGQGTLFNLAGAVPLPDGGEYFTNSVVIDFEQAIPRPVCSDGPYDWLYVTGPVTFVNTFTLDWNGSFQYSGRYDGVLVAVPIDIETYEPIGEPFEAIVGGRQNGQTGSSLRMVMSGDKRLALQTGAPESLTETLKVGTIRNVRYRSFENCFDGE